MTGTATKGKRFERRRETRRSVLVIDRIADAVIRVGGLAVIVAVFGIMAFLVAVVVPLFTGGRLVGTSERQLEIGEAAVLGTSVDDYHTVATKIGADGRLEVLHIATGRRLQGPALDLAGRRVTAFARTIDGRDVAFGLDDGSLRFGTVTVGAQVITADQLPAGLQRLDARDQTDGSAVYSAIPGSQFRKIAVAARLDAPVRAAPDGVAIVALDYHLGGTTERPTRTFVSIDANGLIRLGRSESRVNIMTRQARTSLTTSEMPPLPAGSTARRAVTTDKGDQVYVADAGGIVHRFDTRDPARPVLAESVDLLPGEAALSIFGFLLGQQSLVVGGSDGRVDVYFRLERPDAGTTDGFKLVLAHRLEPHRAAAAAFAPSQRGKLFVTADAAGDVWVRHSTSEQTVLKLAGSGGADGYRAVVLAPREDGVLAVDARGKATFWEIAVPHPETTLGTIFGKVWYEGYEAPGYTWQSSAGTDSFEPKLSLVPLVFGTIKATFYALLFAVPVALLAAVYTSEFVNPAVRATVKPIMEMMASLPSVVLGFIAALILAPVVETWLASVLMVFVALPVALLVAAHAWQLLPVDTAVRLQGLPRLLAMFVVLAGAIGASYAGGSAFEALFFAGDLKAWANGSAGTGFGFLWLVSLPLSYLAVFALLRRGAGDWLLEAGRRLAGPRAALFDSARWLATLALAALLSALIAGALGALGHDPRGGMVGTYVQRNTLVVGFAMGFAVIPIIYTIAEDALNAVPEHLRAASLACGATPWQTATRVILPTAVSGVFAAIMVGMGRAVGETMIVVMAAGNTPILEWNVFNGLRALSANIAVELPEAVRDSTLYRMLFLAALTLFVMTFVVNTLAEVIRQRFRKRAVQL
ncbi:MAG: ABC transporter permease subunit [Alphaproteobacteria bacterium]|nr:ABC transporter permease subunit [Alphaproteobacteria bacterium]